MALDLSSIAFKVDTSELDTAAKKIESLGTSINSLAGNLNKLDKESARAAKTQADANLTNAKAEAILAKKNLELEKAALVQAKTNTETAKAEAIADRVAKANERHTEATERVTKATRERQSVEERQAAITRIMADGFSRGQSSILATAEAYGEATERTAEYLKTQRAMQATSPFDKSLGAATIFANELRVMTVANELYAKGLGFTGTQLQELGREHVRLTEQFKVQGKDLSGLDAEFNNIVVSAKKVTDAENAMASSMKQSDKASNDAGKANAFLAREMQRVDSVLTGFNDNLNITSSNRLLKFREQLKASGTDAVTAEKMLKTYEERLKTINATSQAKASNSRDEELKYLARATSVQLGDIGISLAGGQNPLMVLIQQGDQLRGVLNQVSASGGEMEKALSMAFSQIVVGTKDVVVALGSFVVGAFVDAGKSITEFGAEIFGVKTALEDFKNKKFAEWASEGQAGFDKISKAMAAMQFATSALGIGIGVLIALVASLGVALYQVTNANDTLTRSLIATGAQLGFTTEYAHNLAGALGGMGATRVDVLNAFTEISNSGKITSESFLQVAEAALAIERVGGPAVKETVKLMGDLKDKSIETLSKYAEQTGLVTVAQIEQVRALEKAGDEADANTLATNILTSAIKDQATITYASLSPMAQMWITIKDGISNAWGALQDWAAGDAIITPILFLTKSLASSMLFTADAIATVGSGMAGVVATNLALLQDAKNLDSNLTNFKAIRQSINDIDKEREDAYQKSKRRINQEDEFSAEFLKKQAEGLTKLRKENADLAEASTKYASVQKDIDEETLKNSAKVLSKTEFINKALDAKNKLLGQNNALREKEYEAVVKNAGIEWDKAQKKPSTTKPKVTDAQKGLEIYIDTLNKAEGVTAKFNNELELLQAARNSIDPKFAITAEQYAHAVTELVKQQPFYIKGQKDIADQKEYEIKLIKDQLKYQEELSKIESDNAKFLLGSEADVRKMNSSYELRLELLGKTEEQQTKLKEQAELENKLAESNVKFEAQRLKIKQDFDKLANTPKNNLVEIPWVEAEAKAYQELDEQRRKELIAIHGEVAVKAAEKFAEEFKKISNVLSDAITTALFDGGQAGTKKLKDYITSVFRNAINVQINAVVQTGMNSLINGGPQKGGISGSNWFSDFGGSATNVLSSFGPSLEGEFGAFGYSAKELSGAMNTVGDTLGYLNAAMLGAEGKWGAAVGAGIGTYLGGPLGAFVGEKLGSIVDDLFSGKETHETKYGGVFAYDPSTGTTASSVQKRYGNATGGEIPKQFMQQLLVDTTGYINGMFKSLGSKAQVSYLTGGAESSAEGEAYSFAGGKFSSGGTFGNLNQQGDNLGNATPEQIVKAFTLDLQKATLSALQAAVDLPKSIQEAFKDVDIQGLSEEALTKLSTSISTMITETNSLRTALEVLPFKSIDNLSFDAAQNLIKFSGGIQNLTANLSGYYENFYSAEEKRKQTIQNITKTLNDARAEVGPVIPWTEQEIGSKTRDQFRELFDSITATEPAGSALVAAMLSVQGAFSSVTLSTDELIQKEKERNEKVLDWNNKTDIALNKTTDLQLEWAAALKSVDEPLSTLDDPIKEAINSFYSLKTSMEEAAVSTKNAETALSWQNKIDLALKKTTEHQIELANALKQVDDPLSDLDDPIKVLVTNFYALKASLDATAASAANAAAITSAEQSIGLSKQSLAGASSNDLSLSSAKIAYENAVAAINKLGTEVTGSIQKYTAAQIEGVDLQKFMDEKYAIEFAGLVKDYWTAKVGVNVANVTISNEVLEERKGIQNQLDQLTMTATQLLDKQRAALDSSNVSLFNKLQTEIQADKVNQERITLQNELNSLTLSTNQLTAIQREKIDKSNRALFDEIALRRQQVEVQTALNNITNGYIAAVARQKTATDNLKKATENITNNYVAAVKAVTEADKAVTAARANITNSYLAADKKWKASVENVENAKTAIGDLFTSAVKAAKAADDEVKAAQARIMDGYIAAKKTAEDAATSVENARENITTGYLSAQDAVANAQQRITDLTNETANALVGFADGIRDFLTEVQQSDLGANTKQQQLQEMRSTFSTSLSLAQGGDKEAFGGLTSKARDLLTAERENASSLVDFARASAGITNPLGSLAGKYKANPEISNDPMVKAQQDLAKAQETLVKWQEAISASGARTTAATEDHLTEYKRALREQTRADLDVEKWRKAVDKSGATTATVTAEYFAEWEKARDEAKLTNDTVIELQKAMNAADVIIKDNSIDYLKDYKAAVAQEKLDYADLVLWQNAVRDSSAGTEEAVVDYLKEYKDAQKELAEAKTTLTEWERAVQASGADTVSHTKDLLQEYKDAQAEKLLADADLVLWQKAVQASGAATQKAMQDYLAEWRKANAGTVVKPPVVPEPVPAKPVAEPYTGNQHNTEAEKEAVKQYVKEQEYAAANPSDDLIGSVYMGRYGTKGERGWLGGSAANAEKEYKWKADTINGWARKNNLPTFATGTNYMPNDTMAMLHEGETVIPKKYNPFNPNATSPLQSNNDRLEQMVYALTQEVIGLRAEAQATASHTNKTARILDRVVPDGDAIAIRTAA